MAHLLRGACLGLVTHATLGACASKDDSALHCSESIDTYCSAGASFCVRSWSVSLCGTPTPAFGSCDGYYFSRSAELSTSMTVQYYDKSSGQLVAILFTDADSTKCVAGPADFSPPSCPGHQPPLPPCDAGSD
jgi:hypothetical protein